MYYLYGEEKYCQRNLKKGWIVNMNQALIIIDYSYDFVADDGKLTAGKPAQDVEEHMVNAINAFVDKKAPIFFMMDIHKENDPHHPETKLFPPHNIEGTAGRDLYGKVGARYEEIKSLDNVFLINKTRYSSFAGTNLDLLLRERNIDTVVLGGVVTDICVLHTAIGAYNLGYNIQVLENCVASFNADGHTVALDHMKNSLAAEII